MTLVHARAQLRIMGNLVLVLVLVFETKGLSLRTKETAFIEIALLLFLTTPPRMTSNEEEL